jgi:hypothetical protein
MTNKTEFQRAREQAVKLADEYSLGFEVAESFDHIMNADPDRNPWQAASEALYEWDI